MLSIQYLKYLPFVLYRRYFNSWADGAMRSSHPFLSCPLIWLSNWPFAGSFGLFFWSSDDHVVVTDSTGHWRRRRKEPEEREKKGNYFQFYFIFHRHSAVPIWTGLRFILFYAFRQERELFPVLNLELASCTPNYLTNLLRVLLRCAD